MLHLAHDPSGTRPDVEQVVRHAHDGRGLLYAGDDPCLFEDLGQQAPKTPLLIDRLYDRVTLFELDIRLLDHFVIGEGPAVSMAARGMI